MSNTLPGVFYSCSAEKNTRHYCLGGLKTLKSSPRRKTYINRTGIISPFQKYLQTNGLPLLPINDFFKKLILNLKKVWFLWDIVKFEGQTDLETTSDDQIYVEHFFLTYPRPKIFKIEWFEPKIWQKYWQCKCHKKYVFWEMQHFFLSVTITLCLLLYYTIQN